MGNQADHIDALRREHRELDGSIKGAQRTPGFPSEKITLMKRQKLRLKERIARMTGELQPNQPSVQPVGQVVDLRPVDPEPDVPIEQVIADGGGDPYNESLVAAAGG